MTKILCVSQFLHAVVMALESVDAMSPDDVRV